jgi:hypothetical protein
LLWRSFFANNNTFPQFNRECLLFLFLFFPPPEFVFTDIGYSSLNTNRNFIFNLRLWLFKINLVLVQLVSAFFEIPAALSCIDRFNLFLIRSKKAANASITQDLCFIPRVLRFFLFSG